LAFPQRQRRQGSRRRRNRVAAAAQLEKGVGLRGHACARAELPVPEAESCRGGEGGSGTRTGGGHSYLSSFVGRGVEQPAAAECSPVSSLAEWITNCCYSLLPLSFIIWAYSFLDWVGLCVPFIHIRFEITQHRRKSTQRKKKTATLPKRKMTADDKLRQNQIIFLSVVNHHHHLLD
jgi:hypothetical protein